MGKWLCLAASPFEEEYRIASSPPHPSRRSTAIHRGGSSALPGEGPLPGERLLVGFACVGSLGPLVWAAWQSIIQFDLTGFSSVTGRVYLGPLERGA